jgi:hypothetical protein
MSPKIKPFVTRPIFKLRCQPRESRRGRRRPSLIKPRNVYETMGRHDMVLIPIYLFTQLSLTIFHWILYLSLGDLAMVIWRIYSLDISIGHLSNLDISLFYTWTMDTHTCAPDNMVWCVFPRLIIPIQPSWDDPFSPNWPFYILKMLTE